MRGDVSTDLDDWFRVRGQSEMTRAETFVPLKLAGPKAPPMFAVDPGPERSGFVVFDGVSVWESGVMPNDELLTRIRRTGADRLAIEMIASYGMAVGREVFETCVWVGRFIETWRRMDTHVIGGEWPVIVYRKDVKLHLCGSVKAKDTNIRQALIDRLGKPGTKKNPGPTYGVSGDAWSALAVAVTAVDTLTGAGNNTKRTSDAIERTQAEAKIMSTDNAVRAGEPMTLQAGRELDALVAEKVMGWKRGVRKQGGYVNRVDVPVWKDGNRTPWDVDQWNPSTEISAAWLVVEAKPLGEWNWRARQDDKGRWTAEVRIGYETSYRSAHVASADTLPHAICLAALKAMEAV